MHVVLLWMKLVCKYFLFGNCICNDESHLSPCCRFSLNDQDREISVAQFFKDKYKRLLRFPSLPCIQIGSKRPTYLPMEVLFVHDFRQLGFVISKWTLNVLVLCMTRSARLLVAKSI